MNKKSLMTSFVLFVGAILYGQNMISYNGSGNYELVERTDLRRYDNGRYKGLVSREVSAFIIPASYDDGYMYDGDFYVLENTKRAGQNVDFGLDDAIPSKFKINKNGKLSMIVDNGFPSYRSFPTFPDEAVSIGDSWQGEAVRAVDPLYKGVVTKMPVYVQYTYTGDSFFNGEDVYVIKAKWATRYGMGTGSYYIDFGGDSDLRKASGSHDATIYVSKATGNSVLIRDVVDETFVYSDGNQIRFKGTVSLFTKYPPAIDRMKFLPALKRVAGLTDEEVEALKKPVENWNESTGGGFDDRGDGDFDLGDGGAGSSELVNSQSGNIKDDSDLDDSELWEQVPGYIPDMGNGNEIEKEIAKNNESSSEDKSHIKESIFDKFGSGDGDSSSNREGITSDESKEKSDDINIKVDNTPAGIRLTMENLQFLPDSAQLIPGQINKLNDIAEVLKSVPGGRFLIEGHTASTGYEEGEKKLSVERAQAIAKEFTLRGLERSQIIIKGYGGTRPVADNKTSEGKAKNRRVEITILD